MKEQERMKEEIRKLARNAGVDLEDDRSDQLVPAQERLQATAQWLMQFDYRFAETCVQFVPSVGQNHSDF